MKSSYNYWETREIIEVNGDWYVAMPLNVYSKCTSIYDVIENIKPMEYAPYHTKLIIKTKNNKYFVVEPYDLNNICEI